MNIYAENIRNYQKVSLLYEIITKWFEKVGLKN